MTLKDIFTYYLLGKIWTKLGRGMTRSAAPALLDLSAAFDTVDRAASVSHTAAAAGCSCGSVRCARWSTVAYTATHAYLADLITTSAAATGRAGLRSRPTASSAAAVPRTTSSFGDRSFEAAGPCAWNILSPPLRHVHSAVTFKRQLEAFLHNNAFNLHNYIVRRPCCASAPTSP